MELLNGTRFSRARFSFLFRKLSKRAASSKQSPVSARVQLDLFLSIALEVQQSRKRIYDSGALPRRISVGYR